MRPLETLSTFDPLLSSHVMVGVMVFPLWRQRIVCWQCSQFMQETLLLGHMCTLNIYIETITNSTNSVIAILGSLVKAQSG